MVEKSIQFLDLVAYAFVASQAMFYLLGMSKTVKQMRAESFIELRNLLNQHLQITLRLAYYLSLVISLVWCCFAVKTGSETLLITSFSALFMLLIDIVLLLKGDQPINKVIKTWSSTSYPANWEDYRKKWFAHYHLRQIAGIVGLLSLIAGAVFR